MNIAQFESQISRLTPVGTLSKKNLVALQDSMKIVHFAKGEKIFIEGHEDKSHYYLLEGSISIRSRMSVPKLIEAESPEAQRPLDHFQPRKNTATTKSDCILLQIDSQSFEMVLSWEQSGDYDVTEINAKTDIPSGDWMGRMLKNPIFQNLPAKQLQLLFRRLKAERYYQGDQVVAQGDSGDDFFIVASGRASVMRNTPRTPQGTPVAQLTSGDTFGEDSILSGEPRNASVQILEDAKIMRLSQEDFSEIIQHPNSDSVDFMEAADLVSRNKAKWIDVRQPGEFSQHHPDNSINLPLLFLRLKVTQLDPAYHYIIYCNDGKKSDAGAYLMKKHGFYARALKGGLDATD